MYHLASLMQFGWPATPKNQIKTKTQAQTSLQSFNPVACDIYDYGYTQVIQLAKPCFQQGLNPGWPGCKPSTY